MKHYNKLISVLYILSRLCFRLVILFILIVVASEFFTPDGKIGNGYLSIHHSKGYPLLVNVSPKKSSIQYSETEKNQRIPIKFKKLISEGCKISDTSGVASHYKTIDYIPASEMKFEKIDFNFPNTETNIYIKTSSFLVNFILGLRIYLLLFYYLIITFYSTKILKTLKSDHIFQPEISKYLNIIGVIIMLMELFKIISYQLFDKKLIALLQLRNEMIFGDFSLNNIYNLSLMPFIIGLLFLLLALIFRRGYYIQQENDLMI